MHKMAFHGVSQRQRVALVAVLLTFTCTHGSNATFIVERGGLKIPFPDFAKSKYPGGFDMALANFGSPKYGGTIMGPLIYLDKGYGYEYTCSPPCQYACQSFDAATPPFDMRKELNGSYIMLVDRGPLTSGNACVFVEKVWNAQQAGARGVIVVNYDDTLTTMDAPDGDDERSYTFLENITIPASFVTKSTGMALKSLLQGENTVFVSMDWTDALPRKKHVEWEFWTNSNDECGALCDVQKEFIKSFIAIAKEFDEAGWTSFTPHYIVWQCPDVYKATEQCHSQCIHNGRYCAPDPDGSIEEGYSGAEVVQENLRQLCVFKAANASGKPWLWWDYVTRFAESCAMDTKMYGQECAEEVFQTMNKKDSFGDLDDLRRCVGNIEDDTPHPILEEELVNQEGDSHEGEVFILPTIRINGAQYRGRLAAGEVLQAICAGFEDGNKPPACDRIVDDACMPGGKGATECASRSDGKTRCLATYAGYTCTCGNGFISHMGQDGSETCLDINECLSLSSLDPECTCERCACRNKYGGYECVPDLPNECDAGNHGGCWHQDYQAHGKLTTFTACKDNIQEFRRALSEGKNSTEVFLHTCTCPPCFNPIRRKGQLICEKKCDLDTCDLEFGVCLDLTGGSGVGLVGILGIIFGVAVVCLGLGFVVYKMYARSLMQAEIKAIMAQYMPLDEEEPLR